MISTSLSPQGRCVAVGFQAGYSNIIGYGNVFIGHQAGRRNTGIYDLIIDNADRLTEVGEDNLALIRGKFGVTAPEQYVKINGQIRSANCSVLAASPPSATQVGGMIDINGSFTASSGTSTAAFNAASFYNGNGLMGVIQTSGSATQFLSLSDRDYKKNIFPADSAWPELMQYEVVKFDWRRDVGEDKQHVRHGLIAQQAYAVNPNNASKGDGETPWMTDPAKAVPLLMKALQEIRMEFDTYKETHP